MQTEICIINVPANILPVPHANPLKHPTQSHRKAPHSIFERSVQTPPLAHGLMGEQPLAPDETETRKEN